MKPFIDLVGASGAIYRFRKLEQGQLPATGGNFAYVREQAGAQQVLGCGKARTLARAPAQVAPSLLAEGDLYVRLNVAASVQDSEHEDLIAGLPKPFEIYEIE